MILYQHVTAYRIGDHTAVYIHVRIESAVTTMDQKKTGRLRRVIDVRLTILNFRLILLHSVLAHGHI